jgi:hypothetical protein
MKLFGTCERKEAQSKFIYSLNGITKQKYLQKGIKMHLYLFYTRT